MSGEPVVVDGVVSSDEYTFTKDLGQVQLAISRSADTLWIGVVGKTTGWVAAGLGTLKMDKAAIYIGFVDSSGKVQLKPQLGAGRSHSDTADPRITGSLLSSAMKEEDGKTTLELAFTADTWIDGREALELIYAIGAQDSFSPRHIVRGALSVALAR